MHLISTVISPNSERTIGAGRSESVKARTTDLRNYSRSEGGGRL